MKCYGPRGGVMVIPTKVTGSSFRCCTIDCYILCTEINFFLSFFSFFYSDSHCTVLWHIHKHMFSVTKFDFVCCLCVFLLISHLKAMLNFDRKHQGKSHVTFYDGGLTQFFSVHFGPLLSIFRYSILKQGSRIPSCNATQESHLDTTHPKSFAVCPSRRRSCRPAQHIDCRSWRSEAAPVGLSHNQCQLQRF